MEEIVLGAGDAARTLQAVGGPGDQDAVVAKYTAEGDLEWAAAIGGDGSVGYSGLDLLVDEIMEMGVTSEGDVIVVGWHEINDATIRTADETVEMPGDDDRALMLRLSSAGEVLWARAGHGYSAAFGKDGGIYTGGRFSRDHDVRFWRAE